MDLSKIRLGVSEVTGNIYLGSYKNSEELNDQVDFTKEFFKALMIYFSFSDIFYFNGHKYKINLQRVED
ncbi:MAG: hypothetical protein ACI4M9_03965 [Succinivibrio sp.]